MKIYPIFLFVLLFAACEDNLSSISQDFIGNEGNVYSERIPIENVYTVKLDSFATSSNAMDILLMGKYDDSTVEQNVDYSGKTTSIPCFQLSPYAYPRRSASLTVDSVTLDIPYSGELWGDTLNPKMQYFDLYQLKEMPVLNTEEKDYYFYNNTPVDHQGEILATMRVMPVASQLRKAHFRLSMEDGSLASYLWEQSLTNSDEIFTNLPWSFTRDFLKGLIIVPRESNNCMIGIKPSSDSLTIRFHYKSKGNIEGVLNFPLAQTDYMFNHIDAVPSSSFAGLKTQKEAVSFDDSEMSLAQGLGGYLIKIDIPKPEATNKYVSVIKAEIVMEPSAINATQIPYPRTLNLIKTNEYNDLLGSVYMDNGKNMAVSGTLTSNKFQPQIQEYVFDITNEYKKLMYSFTGTTTETQFLITIPGIGTNFERVIIKKKPYLRIYYATYKI